MPGISDNLLLDLPKIASTAVLAFFSFWGSIPAGFALGLSPLAVFLAAVLGYTSGVGVVTLAGGRVRSWILQRMGRRATLDPNSRVYRIWERYGMIGLGLLAPLTTGAQIGAAIGLAMQAPPRRLFVAMTIGGLVWGVILVAAVMLGLAGVEAVR